MPIGAISETVVPVACAEPEETVISAADTVFDDKQP